MISIGEMISARRDRDASLRKDSTSPAQHATLEKSSPLASLRKRKREVPSLRLVLELDTTRSSELRLARTEVVATHTGARTVRGYSCTYVPCVKEYPWTGEASASG